MIFQCSDLERALRTPDLIPDARAHAERCQRCSEQLYWWARISDVAPQLHEEWESNSLWPRIAQRLAAEPAPRRSRVWHWALAAAAMVSLSLALLLAPHRGAPPSNPDLLNDAALREVRQAEQAYAKSIDKLAVTVGPSLNQSPTPLAAAYREKLLLLDSAIAELKANVEQNSYNANLRTQLASLYGEKQKTLQEWMTHAKHN